LDLGNHDLMPHPFERVHRRPAFAIDPKAALLGATSRWYVLMTKPDPAPFDLLRQLVNNLTPEERGKVLGQVQEIDARFKALAKMLRRWRQRLNGRVRPQEPARPHARNGTRSHARMRAMRHGARLIVS
jgi:hypothetical protein